MREEWSVTLTDGSVHTVVLQSLVGYICSYQSFCFVKCRKHGGVLLCPVFETTYLKYRNAYNYLS